MENILFKKKTNYFLISTYSAVLCLQIYFITHGFSGMPDLVGKALLITLATPYMVYVFVKEILFIKRGADSVFVNTQNNTVNFDGREVDLSENSLLLVVKNVSPFYTLVLDGVKMSGYYVLEKEYPDISEYPFLEVTKQR